MLGTLLGRAVDARRARPLLADRAALAAVERIDPADLEWAGVDEDLALSVAARALLLDRWAGAFLDRHADAVVLHLGCGLDTRYQRLAPGAGVDWYEVDHPEVVALRQELLPPAGEHQHTVAADVTSRGWLDAVPAGRPTLVVAEGLTMYLRPETGGALLGRLVDRFGAGAGAGGEMVFDVYSTLGVRLQGANPVVRRSGARLGWGVDDPRSLEALGLSLLEQLDAGQMLTPDLRDQMSPRLRLRLRTALAVPAFRRMGRLLRYAF